MRMTERERRFFAPIMSRIDSGYRNFRFYYASGDCFDVEFEMYHEAYYDDDEFEIDFRITKVIKKREWDVSRGTVITIGMSGFPENGFDTLS